jgi:hypothetical protein
MLLIFLFTTNETLFKIIRKYQKDKLIIIYNKYKNITI